MGDRSLGSRATIAKRLDKKSLRAKRPEQSARRVYERARAPGPSTAAFQAVWEDQYGNQYTERSKDGVLHVKFPYGAGLPGRAARVEPRAGQTLRLTPVGGQEAEESTIVVTHTLIHSARRVGQLEARAR